MRYKIVIDSCGELVEKWKDSPAVERASLTLTVDDEDIIDDDTFDQSCIGLEIDNRWPVPENHLWFKASVSNAEDWLS